MTPLATTPEEIVNEVFALYEQHGDEDYIGEPVSQIEHMSQSAALAQAEGYDDEVILAAFFMTLATCVPPVLKLAAWMEWVTLITRNWVPTICWTGAFRQGWLTW
jgi:hypothetical protein